MSNTTREQYRNILRAFMPVSAHNITRLVDMEIEDGPDSETHEERLAPLANALMDLGIACGTVPCLHPLIQQRLLDDAELTAESLVRDYNHFYFRREDWRDKVAANQTMEGYWSWAHSQLVVTPG